MTKDKEIIGDDEYIAVGFPNIQKYMDSPRWDEIGFDADKDLWFVPKDMINEYIAVGFPNIQKYMDSPRWDEIGFDADKDLWFVPKDMIKYE